jgi:Fur family iron response transcriptional regulator
MNDAFAEAFEPADDAIHDAIEAAAVSRPAMVGGPVRGEDAWRQLLNEVGLKPTRQRLALSEALFGSGGRHVTADIVCRELAAAGEAVSRGTVYNTLHEFTRAGLVRQIGACRTKSFFDTNPSAHHHFFVDGEDRLLDIEDRLVFARFPEIPEGYEVAGVDAIVHLRRRAD